MLVYPSLLSDLDGTLIDTKKVMNSTFEELCEKHISKRIKSRAFSILYKSPSDALRLIGIYDLSKYWKIFKKNVFKARAFPNIKLTLENLSHEGLTIGIITSLPAKRANLLIEAVNIEQLISFIIGWELTIPRKPNPHPIYKAIEKLPSKRRVLFIGDSQDDIIAGKRAGISTGFVTWGYYPEDVLTVKPDYVISTPFQLGIIIKSGKLT